MYKRLSELNFVIGLFFTIVSLILLTDTLLNREISGKMNLYTGLVFLIFGLLMITIRTKRKAE